MLRRQFRDKRFIRIGSLAPQLMIEVHYAQHDAQVLPQLQQQKQKRHRIRAAGHRHAHALARA